MNNYYLGLDFGTSGARAIALNQESEIIAQGKYAFNQENSENLALIWQKALFSLIEQIPVTIRANIRAIAINGTSSTVLLCNTEGEPITEPILYHDAKAKTILAQIRAISPPNHVVLSATSSLAKLLWWQHQQLTTQAHYFLHQADWLLFLLHGQLGITDYHNALKLGYDVINLTYPQWLTTLPCAALLPQVVAPGTPISTITPQIAKLYQLSPDCLVCAGTTDSIAAFIASGANIPGQAVTSLGSTLVLKLLSQTPITDTASGIYSHRLGDLWLTGGASNTGGAVLKHFFTTQELEDLSLKIDPNQDIHLDYYPLLTPGERFPINNPHLQPRLQPRPDNPVIFLHGLLQSIAKIEALGYQRLQQLGATPLTQVFTAGGGANNLIWQNIRQNQLGVPVSISVQSEAAYGTALLGMSPLIN